MNDAMVNGETSSGSPKSSGSLFVYAVVALALAFAIRFFIAAPYVVSGASMEPTFFDYHYLIIDRVAYNIGNPERGDVIVFKYPPQPSRSLIKRVIGLPGERVVIEGSTIHIYNDTHPDGFALDEPYIASENRSYGDRMDITLGEHEYIVLGDNRSVSADSRLWGALPEADIIGRVDLRLFPFNQIEILPGDTSYSNGNRE